MPIAKNTIPLVGAVLLSVALASPSLADRNYGRVKDELTKTECGACHMSFQAAFLPAASWQAVMSDLGNHFGEDASLDDESRAKITDYLVANAGRNRKTKDGKPPLRITKLRWFVGEHRGEVSKRAMKRAGTMSNCAACHNGAENGYFDDD